MKWRKKRKARRRHSNDTYSFIDLLLDMIDFFPQMILLPFRIAFHVVKSIGRALEDILSGF